MGSRLLSFVGHDGGIADHSYMFLCRAVVGKPYYHEGDARSSTVATATGLAPAPFSSIRKAPVLPNGKLLNFHLSMFDSLSGVDSLSLI